MPASLQEQFRLYENEYSKVKRGRKLFWLDHLGTIELDIELADRQVSLEVTPLQAATLHAFQDHGDPFERTTDSDQLSVADLCEFTGSTPVSARRAALFWVLQGILKETTADAFYVLEHAEEPSSQGDLPSLIPLTLAIAASALVVAELSNVQSAAEQAESEMQVYW
jgi:anaphase-promoting complex subunit 2